MTKLFFSSDSVICGFIFLPLELFYFNQASSKYGTTFNLVYKPEMWFQKYVVLLYFTYKMSPVFWIFSIHVIALL